MAKRDDFLVEIGTEELPPKALSGLSLAFQEGLASELGQAGLKFREIERFATPRRLAVLVSNLETQQADKETERRGPPVKVAYDKDGKPTRAALAFAETCGVEPDALETESTPKGDWLVWRGTEKGQDARDLLPGIVQRSLDRLPIPRRMRWGAGEAEFVRPVHWVIMLLGTEVVPGPICGVEPGNETRGHRFMAPDAIALKKPGDYVKRLRIKGKVLANFNERRKEIAEQVAECAAKAGGDALLNAPLLDEITSLVEWPAAIEARFDEEFLSLPTEVLTATLVGHQRYVPVQDENGLSAAFVVVANIDSQDPDQVRAGNQRVVRPRLADSMFFWNSDKKTSLQDRVSSLKNVLFQNKLGSVHDKSKRVAKLAAGIAKRLGGDPKLATRAATLAKCDLLTDMVGEFPELQGIMGRYYARNDGEPAELAQSLAEQYQPRFAGDALPESTTGRALAIGDKIDTICGIFAAGQKPSGNKDPFALRRNALGCLRILIEGELDLSLTDLIAEGIALQPVKTRKGLADEIYEFMMDRLRAYYLDDENIGPEMFDAVLANRPDSPLDFHQRLAAVRAFRDLDAAESLAAANKRIANILRKNSDPVPEQPDAALMTEKAEKALFDRVQAMSGKVRPLLEQRRYRESLELLAGLREPVDEFFDQVMVMDDDPAIRGNRLALLAQMRALFLITADLSRLSA